LIDGSKRLENWNVQGDANWRAENNAIVNYAQVPVPLVHKAGGQWNTMEIVASGSLVTVKLNGNTTATLNNNKFPSGPFALQFGAGVNNAVGDPIQWREVMIEPN
jgi:hypothetical protein